MDKNVCLQVAAFVRNGIRFFHYFSADRFALLERSKSRIGHIPKIFSDFHTNNAASRFDQKIGTLIRANVTTRKRGQILSEFLKVKLFGYFVHTRYNASKGLFSCKVRISGGVEGYNSSVVFDK